MFCLNKNAWIATKGHIYIDIALIAINNEFFWWPTIKGSFIDTKFYFFLYPQIVLNINPCDIYV